MDPESVLGPGAARSGHFLYESGHHGDLWLDLELLCLQPQQLHSAVEEFAAALRPLELEMVCGPLNEGAFVALMVAERMGIEFCYAERFERERAGLFPVRYRLPRVLRERVRGKRIAIVNDVINAGSAVRGAHEDLVDASARPVALAALLVLGDMAARFGADRSLELISLAHRPIRVWAPEECPLCAAGVPLEEP